MKKWHNILNKFKKKDAKHRYENGVCKNCGTNFSGHFCPECGQSVSDYDKPFSFIFYNFVGDFFAFDTRFFRTFGALLIKPGFLTKQYFEGKRIRYAPPFRIFIFISFIMFLLLQIYTNRGLTTVLDSNLGGNILLDSVAHTKADSIINQVKSELGTTDSIVGDSVLNLMGIAPDSADTSDLNLRITMETFRDTKDLRQTLNNLANEMENELVNVTDQKERAKKMEFIRLARSPEQAVTKFLEYLSWAFFLLLPIFAIFLKLLYIRRKQNYIRHLIFSIHTHSFIFIVFTIIILLYLLSGGDIENSIAESSGINNISILLTLSVPVYIIIALKKFYGQSWGKVILKFLTVSILYNIIFWIAVGIVFLNAISII
jgi:hypothetical protein